jgi:hypothetical protein
MQGQTRLRRIAESPGEAEDSGALETEASPPSSAFTDAQRRAAGLALQMALRTLSQKTLVALSSLYSLLLAGAVFWVFWRILADPSVLQLVGAGMFGIFALAIHLVRKR